MRYISERIKNISELEEIIQAARLKSAILADAIKKAVPINKDLNEMAYSLNKLLDKADSFEFCIEQRVSEFIDASEHHE